MAMQNRTGIENNLIFKKVLNEEYVSEKELLVSGIIPSPTRKVS